VVTNSPEATAEEQQVDTAVEAPETPPEETLPETEGESAPETEPTPEPETPDIEALLSNLDESDLRKISKVSELLESDGNRRRREAESATARKIAQERNEWVQKGGYTSDLQTLLTEAAASADEDGKISLESDKVDAVASKMWEALSLGAFQRSANAIDATLPDGATFTAEQVTSLEEIRDGVLAGRLQPEDLLTARAEMIVNARVEAMRSEIVEQERSAAQKRMEAELTSERARITEQVRGEQPAPTKTNGTAPGRSFQTQADVNRAFVNWQNEAGSVEERLPYDEYYRMRTDGTYDALPRQ